MYVIVAHYLKGNNNMCCLLPVDLNLFHREKWRHEKETSLIDDGWHIQEMIFNRIKLYEK